MVVSGFAKVSSGILKKLGWVRGRKTIPIVNGLIFNKKISKEDFQCH